MKIVFKILFGCIILFQAIETKAQNESYLQPFSGLLITNSAFAGSNGNTNFHSGNQYYSVSKEEAYNLFYVTYDTYFNKIKGGVGITFQHGLIGQRNISTTELGISYAGFKIKTNNGQIIPSLNTGIMLATKQWYAFITDRMFSSRDDLPNSPGKQYTRYSIFKPGAAFLWETNDFLWGISGTYLVMESLSETDQSPYKNEEGSPLSLTFYLSRKISGNRHGIKSSPYQAYPELTIFYNEDFIFSRFYFKMEHVDKSFGLFIQNDFTNNIHSVGGSIGYKLNNMHFKLNTGIGIPGISESIGATGELSLSIIIPPVHYSKIKPWSPKEK